MGITCRGLSFFHRALPNPLVHHHFRHYFAFLLGYTPWSDTPKYHIKFYHQIYILHNYSVALWDIHGYPGIQYHLGPSYNLSMISNQAIGRWFPHGSRAHCEVSEPTPRHLRCTRSGLAKWQQPDRVSRRSLWWIWFQVSAVSPACLPKKRSSRQKQAVAFVDHLGLKHFHSLTVNISLHCLETLRQLRGIRDIAATAMGLTAFSFRGQQLAKMVKFDVRIVVACLLLK